MPGPWHPCGGWVRMVETECRTFQEFIVRNARRCIGGIRTGFQNTWFVQGPNLNHLHVKQCTSWWFQPFFLLFSSWLTSFEQVPISITSAWTCMKVHRKRFGHVCTYVLKMYEYQIPVQIPKQALWTQMAKPSACDGCCAGDFGLGPP